MVTSRALAAWVLLPQMTCHLHILVMSGELATGGDLYSLKKWNMFHFFTP